MRTIPILAAVAALFVAAASPAQNQPAAAPPEDDGQLVVDVIGGQRAALPIAIPYMPTPQATDTPAGNTSALGRQVADIVATDLRNSGLFTPIGPNQIPCCGSFGLASDGTTLYFTSRSFLPGGGAQVTINSFDPVTGELGTPVVVQSPTIHIEEMRFWRGTLYAVTRDAALVTVDPATGEVESVPIPPERYKAMEVFE